MNSLLIANQYDLNLNIIIINNQGGQIFNTLPYSNKIDNSLESYWTTPVDLSIKECSKLYKANYSSLKSIEEIENRLDENLDTKGLNIIEIECDYKNTQKIEAEINNEF
jgi:2-succinyl-5-enolpyruvyl-6-hydroxy-3-cyclohexene-1-carboxylate synthase